MKRTDASLTFSYKSKEYKASVSMLSPDVKGPVPMPVVFTPDKTPMVRVQVATGEKHEPVFIFWKVKPGQLFWHDLSGDFQKGMAKKIATSLLEVM